MALSDRPVPPGCCPGCLLEHATEPCPLHRAAADLLTLARAVAGRFVGTDDPLGVLARELLAKVEGR